MDREIASGHIYIGEWLLQDRTCYLLVNRYVYQ